MSTTTIAITLFIILSAIMPARLQNLINSLLLIPGRQLSQVISHTNNFRSSFASNLKNILFHGGITSNHLKKVVGTIFLLSISTISLLADFEMLAMGFSALGYGRYEQYLLSNLGLDTSIALAIVLTGGCGFAAAIYLEMAKVTDWLPNSLLLSRKENKSTFKYISLILFLGYLLSAAILAYERQSADGFSSIDTEQLASLDESEIKVLLSTSNESINIVMIFLAVAAIITSAIGAILLPSLPPILLSIILLLILPLNNIVLIIANVLYQLLNSVYNIVVILSNIIHEIWVQIYSILQSTISSLTNLFQPGREGSAVQEQTITNVETQEGEVREYDRISFDPYNNKIGGD